LQIRVAGPLRRFACAIPFDVVGDDREMDLQSCLGKADPSHASEAVAAVPGSESQDLFNPGANGPRQTIVRFAPCGGPSAMALAHELRGSAPGLDRLFDRQRIIGPVGINLARLIEDN
jgi:hypothetical protein